MSQDAASSAAHTGLPLPLSVSRPNESLTDELTTPSPESVIDFRTEEGNDLRALVEAAALVVAAVVGLILLALS
jgi:hypothetical protein